MSTKLTPIQGRVEIPNISKRECEYINGNLHITRFSGGLQGSMLQLSTYPNDHIQLSKEQVIKLRDTLNEFLK